MRPHPGMRFLLQLFFLRGVVCPGLPDASAALCPGIAQPPGRRAPLLPQSVSLVFLTASCVSQVVTVFEFHDVKVEHALSTQETRAYPRVRKLALLSVVYSICLGSIRVSRNPAVHVELQLRSARTYGNKRFVSPK